MFGLGPTELLIVLTIFMILFGAKRLPEIAKGLGRGITEFKREIHNVNSTLTDSTPQVKGGQNEVN